MMEKASRIHSGMVEDWVRIESADRFINGSEGMSGLKKYLLKSFIDNI